jgi:hypothetical protein
MSLKAILVRFPDESVKLDDVEERSVLTTLKVIYKGGSLNDKTADFPTRDLERVVLHVHGRNRHFFQTYERTICVDIRSRRTIFRYAGLTSKSNNSSWWKRLLCHDCAAKRKSENANEYRVQFFVHPNAAFRIGKLKAIQI